MSYSEIKLWCINTVVVTATFTNIDNILKIILLLLTIGYTIDKWLLMRKNKNKDE